jgi:hypothetical protein
MHLSISSAYLHEHMPHRHEEDAQTKREDRGRHVEKQRRVSRHALRATRVSLRRHHHSRPLAECRSGCGLPCTACGITSSSTLLPSTRANGGTRNRPSFSACTAHARALRTRTSPCSGPSTASSTGSATGLSLAAQSFDSSRWCVVVWTSGAHERER